VAICLRYINISLKWMENRGERGGDKGTQGIKEKKRWGKG
jgi:hypothetical protein